MCTILWTIHLSKDSDIITAQFDLQNTLPQIREREFQFSAVISGIPVGCETTGMLIANTLGQCEHERESFLDASIAKSEILKCNPGNTSYSFIYPINIYRDYTMFLLFKRSILYDFCAFIDCSTPGFPILHHLPVFIQTHVHWVGDVI